MTKKRRTDIELREYKITREKNKQLRKYAPNPFASLNEHGIVGKATNKVANHIAEKPIRNIAYRMTSRKYKKGQDAPSKGSDIYTSTYFSIKKVLKFIVGFLVALITGGSLIAFFMADVLGKISIGLGLAFIVLLVAGIKSLFHKKKRK